jgi:hypothetical protein
MWTGTAHLTSGKIGMTHKGAIQHQLRTGIDWIGGNKAKHTGYPIAGLGGVIVDMDAEPIRDLFVHANITGLTTKNRAAGKSAMLRMVCPTGANISFASEMVFIGAKPTVLTSGKQSLLSLTCFNSELSGVLAVFGEED